MSERTFVIAGAGLAGAKAAQALREEGFSGVIRLVGNELERPYERPPLSKGYLTGTADRGSIYVHEAGWYDDHDVELPYSAAQSFMSTRSATRCASPPASHCTTANC